MGLEIDIPQMRYKEKTEFGGPTILKLLLWEVDYNFLIVKIRGGSIRMLLWNLKLIFQVN